MQQGFALSRIQRQGLSQRQMLAVKMMPLSSVDLREQILAEESDNPALSVSPEWKQPESEVYSVSPRKGFLGIPSFFERYSRSRDVAGSVAADSHQSMIEQVAESKSLQDHLLSQIRLLRKEPDVLQACRLIVGNLDDHGFFSTPIASVPGLENDVIRDRALFIVRNLDPEGLACADVWESLAFQASISTRQVPLYTDQVLLKYHHLLRRRRPDLLARNLSKYGIHITERHARMMLDFIATLNPNPAAAFGKNDHYVAPDVYVDVSSDVVSVRLAKTHGDGVSLNSGYAERLKDTSLSSDERATMRANIKKAKLLAESLAMVNNSLLRIATEIVTFQADFFVKPNGVLRAITQREVAAKTGLSESTVSRIISYKYLLSPRGFMKLSALFSAPLVSSGAHVFSRDEVQRAIADVVSSTELKLSDQRIAELLANRGIKIARRTVTKYRQLMNMGSSFDLSR